MSQAIVITSGKGGSGKSTLAKNIAQRLCAMGKSVVLVDMDMGMRSLDLMLGLQDKVVYDLVDVAEGLCKLKQALIRVEPNKEFYLLNAAQTRGEDAVSPAQAEGIVKRLKDRFEFVLIDCPAGVGKGFRNAIAGADAAILVATPDALSQRDAERVAGLLTRGGVSERMLVVNRVPLLKSEQRGMIEPEVMAEALRIPLLGWLPEQSGMAGAGAAQGPAGRAVEDIAGRLLGEDIPMEKRKAIGYWARVAHALSGKE